MEKSQRLYTAEQVRQGEKTIAAQLGIELYDLMQRAGVAVFERIQRLYPKATHCCVLVGSGNNGGDGWEVATLAKQAGWQVSVFAGGEVANLSGDAKRAYEKYTKASGEWTADLTQLPTDFDVIVDALLGTGLSGVIRPHTQTAIDWINNQAAPVISIDIPSGLHADTGVVQGSAVMADHTVTLIGVKRGLLTGKGRDCVGQWHLDDLGVGKHLETLFPSRMETLIPSGGEWRPRHATIHKGELGKALLIGGDQGMGGAIILASEACLNTGCGLTATLTHSMHITPLLVRAPEIMVNDVFLPNALSNRLAWCQAVAVGPGLGREALAETACCLVQESALPSVWDADALHWLAKNPHLDAQRILTPHPGEAASLLGCSVAEVESDRFASVARLQRQYGGVIILKGAGTLVCDGEKTWVCLAGNAAMATSGMGDVLTGILVGLLAQGLSVSAAAKLGTWLHSFAADEAVRETPKCVLRASDLFCYLPQILKTSNFS